MKYSIKKDVSTCDTISKTKDIIDALNIKLTTIVTGNGKNYFSYRITIENTQIGSCGKGASGTNALASGYAEKLLEL